MTAPYRAGRFYAAAPVGVRFKDTLVAQYELLAIPLSLRENLTLTTLELLQVSPGEQQGIVKIAIYSAINGLPSGAPLVAADIAVKPKSRAIWQPPADSSVTIDAGDYFVTTFVAGHLKLRAIDGESQEIESILGRASLADARPVTAITPEIDGQPIPVTQLPRTFDGTEIWQDRHSVSAPVIYLAS